MKSPTQANLKKPIVKAVDATSDFKGIQLLLDRHFSNSRTAPHERLLRHQWVLGNQPRGYVLEVDGKVVGYHACITATRDYGADEYPTRNMSTWVVDEEYRAYGLQLLMPCLKFPQGTLTVISATDTVRDIYKKFGFKTLSKTVRVFVPDIASWHRKNWGKYKITSKPEEVERLLSKRELQIFYEHRQYDCQHTVIQDAGSDELCYVVSIKTIKRQLPFVVTLFRSNPRIFSACFSALKWHWFRTNKTPLSMVHDNLQPKEGLGLGWDIAYKELLYKSKHQVPHEIDYLYSEFALLNFA